MTNQDELKAQCKHQLEKLGVEIMEKPFVLRTHVGTGVTTIGEKKFEFSMELSGATILITRTDNNQCVSFSVKALNKMAEAMGLYDEQEEKNG